MRDLILAVDSPGEITQLAGRVRTTALNQEFSRQTVLELFEQWAAALQGKGLDETPGVAFLRLWLRRGTLEPILRREMGVDSLDGSWAEEGRARFMTFPLGLVGHWPAGNIEIQPVLSMSCALLGGNSCLVRVPSGLVAATRPLLEKLDSIDQAGLLAGRFAMIAFDHAREDLHRAMAQTVDGAMIWGGAEAVSHIRTLPFPHWARLAVFGPRLSVAAMDAGVWNGGPERASWCRRLARDVWQFEQQACSSPQALFLERAPAGDVGEFVAELRRAFEEENRAHPRREIHPGLTSAICLARASWLLGDVSHAAWFPGTADWTILLGSGAEIPTPTQGRTLHVLVVADLLEAIAKFDGNVQTLGLAISDPRREGLLAKAAGRRGVDRIVKLGRMHVFSSPWDGVDLIRPMVRVVRHVPSRS
jgi:hypothetical protein